MKLTPGTTFKYHGPAQKTLIEGDADWQDVNIVGSLEFTVDEIHPYEPSAYVWEDGLTATTASDPAYEYWFSTYRIWEAYGLCLDCGVKHDKGCPLDAVDDLTGNPEAQRRGIV